LGVIETVDTCCTEKANDEQQRLAKGP
jgi:hypothetical protein